MRFIPFNDTTKRLQLTADPYQAGSNWLPMNLAEYRAFIVKVDTQAGDNTFLTGLTIVDVLAMQQP